MILSQTEQVRFYDEVLCMLQAADNEFVPPLSARNSTTQADLKTVSCAGGVRGYFEELKKQKLLAAVEDDELLGFVSFKENYTCSVIGEEELPNIYISTLIVKPEARGKGLTRKMYESLFSACEGKAVFTRTWSQNAAHITILSKFGFEEYRRLENDRGDGIDTVYFRREAQ